MFEELLLVTKYRGGRRSSVGTTAITRTVPLGHDLRLEDRVVPASTLAELFSGAATFNVDTDYTLPYPYIKRYDAYNGGIGANMRFMAFARDSLNSFYRDQNGD